MIVPIEGQRVRNLKHPGLGTVSAVHHAGACTITWDNGLEQKYAMAAQGTVYEILDAPRPPKAKKKPAAKKKAGKKPAKKKAGKKKPAKRKRK